MHAESRGGKEAHSPTEKLIKTLGEKNDTSLGSFLQVLREIELTDLTSELEQTFYETQGEGKGNDITVITKRGSSQETEYPI